MNFEAIKNPSDLVGDIAIALQSDIQKTIDRKLSLLDIEMDKSVCLLLVAVTIQEVLAEMLLAGKRLSMTPGEVKLPPIDTINAAITVTSMDVLTVTVALRDERERRKTR